MGMDDVEIESALKRAEEVAAEWLPSWQGGFAVQVANAIKELQRRNKILVTALHNKRCIDDDELIYCECKKEYTKTEMIDDACSDCGGVFSYILIQEDKTTSNENE